MLNPFKKKSESIYSPVSGRIVSLDEVPDPVFAQRSVGDGFAIEPTDGSFRSPVDGELVLVAKTLHAFAVRTHEGAEILVHIGIDTVTLKGEGFTGHRQAGDMVSRGDLIISCDLDAIRTKVPSMVTPVLLTNGTKFSMSSPEFQANGASVITVRRK
ncbi:PTS glucose transporter subunit IIA [Pseudarthrobacter sp. AL07]|uniref:PTS sugar transporter subunit IIA n=1 Tax=unclassified Pseudarthrobacter TaxID=2647000 RepID=UPI00249A2C93|nr:MULTISPECIES: PTS glucose transporter subunit IIA [unclassified Pseudarthrobacter]MDI3196144.1 PTS glucose transporter subunit IIA [Pseudarthrobacter sp. AL20]MDI3210215.1 PTS glucose transporter subunit IIA [Pseudarthrobacter sp. AL07]